MSKQSFERLGLQLRDHIAQLQLLVEQLDEEYTFESVLVVRGMQFVADRLDGLHVELQVLAEAVDSPAAWGSGARHVHHCEHYRDGRVPAYLVKFSDGSGAAFCENCAQQTVISWHLDPNPGTSGAAWGQFLANAAQTRSDTRDPARPVQDDADATERVS